MLLIHSSSSCDICFEPFQFVDGTDLVPHSLPCGHVFCRTCLMSIPNCARICPFCRKSFELLEIRKLHLAPVEETDKDREAALLEKFVLAAEPEDPSELESIMAEVDAWLEQGKVVSFALRG
ncbi:uncharacterized protein BT62DRAFT_909837 [Guyanagaster necrorhizus]|uniref:RING-type domain-containing protein n=1 Tax=Guyanagaster necrorhizus TaxID=856835 RepID=A0A9P7VGV3_9AGAR|nr:uncharacterized protein BT62DRAFT_909837 [Guyanagaster necrorhizus MCA 3950]KAG7440773.1 hypothetical protein BT62DRAFT_909837 [Guyanagaster necrorhizus MCA 3950]